MSLKQPSERRLMARYIVLASLDPRNIPRYYVVDTADNSRVRCYDCELWARHEAERMNGVTERRQAEEKSLLHRLITSIFGGDNDSDW